MGTMKSGAFAVGPMHAADGANTDPGRVDPYRSPWVGQPAPQC